MRLSRSKHQQLKFFVSIGAGLNQIPLISQAKKIGFHVIGVDNNAMAPGFMKCDIKIQESIENYKSIYKILRELLIDGDIMGIMTKSYGVAIQTVSYLTDKFKIPFIPFEMAGRFIEKKKMKSSFINSGIATPWQYPVSDEPNPAFLEKFPFPIIIKPDIGHAKKHVRLIKNISDLRKNIKHLNKLGINAVAEQYVKGDELIAAGIIHNKKYHLISLSDKKTTEEPFFVDLLHLVPSQYENLSGKISAIGQSVTDGFSIQTSPLIMEFVVDHDKNLFLIEAVPEFGGEFIPDIMIPHSIHYDFIGEAIKAMAYNSFNPPLMNKKKNRIHVAIRYITGKGGVLASFNPEGPRKLKSTIFSRIFKEIGSEIREPETNLDRIGVVVSQGNSRDEAIKLADASAESFNIRIK